MKKFFWPAIETLAVLLLLAGAFATAKGIFGNRYEAEYAVIKARHEPTTVQELIGGPIPDDQNAAVAYMQFDVDIKNGPYAQTLKTIDGFPSSPGLHLADSVWMKAEDALTKVQPLRPLLDDAVSRPKCRFDMASADPLTMTFPYLSTLRKAQLILRTSALVNAKHGRMDQALRDIHEQMGVVRSVRSEPFLINHFVRLSMLGVMTKNVLAVAELSNLSEAQARKLFEDIGRADIAASRKRAWEGERVAYINLSDPNYFTRAAAASSSSGPSTKQILTGHAYALWGQTVLRGDTAVSLHYATSQVEGANLSYRDAKARGLVGEPKDIPFYAIVTKLLLPGVGGANIKGYVVAAELAETRVFLALQAYRARYGGYPASIRELRSKLGWKLPKDPFSGKDLIYVRRNKGFEVYSIGPDMKDDGGRPCPNSGRSPNERGDIVLMWEK